MLLQGHAPQGRRRATEERVVVSATLLSSAGLWNIPHDRHAHGAPPAVGRRLGAAGGGRGMVAHRWGSMPHVRLPLPAASYTVEAPDRRCSLLAYPGNTPKC